MKKALILTDCSVDQGIALTNYLKKQPEPIDLTIVYAYALTPESEQTLKAADHRIAKAEARQILHTWLNFLPNTGVGTYRTDTLLGNPELVLQIYLLLRQYDYMLVDFWQQEVLSAFAPCEKHTCTALRYLSLPVAEVATPVCCRA